LLLVIPIRARLVIEELLSLPLNPRVDIVLSILSNLKLSVSLVGNVGRVGGIVFFVPILIYDLA